MEDIGHLGLLILKFKHYERFGNSIQYLNPFSFTFFVKMKKELITPKTL